MANVIRSIHTDDVENYTCFVKNGASWDYHTFRAALGGESFDIHEDWKRQIEMDMTDIHWGGHFDELFNFVPDRGKRLKYQIKIERRPLISPFDTAGTAIYGHPGADVFRQRLDYIGSLRSVKRDDFAEFEGILVNLKARATVETRSEDFPDPIFLAPEEYDPAQAYEEGDTAKITVGASFTTFYCIIRCKGVAPPNRVFWSPKMPVGFRAADKRAQVVAGLRAQWVLYLFDDSTGAYGAYRPPAFAAGAPHDWGHPGDPPISFFNPFTTLIDSDDPDIPHRFGEGFAMNKVFEPWASTGIGPVTIFGDDDGGLPLQYFGYELVLVVVGATGAIQSVDPEVGVTGDDGGPMTGDDGRPVRV